MITMMMQQFQDKLLPLLIMLSLTLTLRKVLIKSGLNNYSSYNNLLIFLLLPLCTYSITKVISGNIALSLGMVGALSIVRFRTPVKSQLEIVILFILISSGITLAVSTQWTIILLSLCLISIILVSMYKNYFLNRGINIFNSYFHDSVELNTLEVNINTKISFIENSPYIRSINFIDGSYTYVLASESKQELQNIINNLKEFQYEYTMEFV